LEVKFLRQERQNTFYTIFSFAGECKGKMTASVLCALVSVIGGWIPFYGVYRIILLFFEGEIQRSEILYWTALCLFGYFVKILFYGISTTLSHRSAYRILENIRLTMADKLIKAPMGEIFGRTAGGMKSIMIDRVETIELPLAHMIPEGISNLVLPCVVYLYMISIDWRMALAALVTVPIGGLVYGFMMKNFNTQYAAYMEAGNHVNSVMVEYVEGIEVIKTFNRAGSSYEKFVKAVTDFKKFTLDWFTSTWKLMNLGAAILPSTLLGVLPLGIYLYTKGELTPAELTMCMILSMSIVGPVTWFNTAVNDYKSIQFAIRDAGELLFLPELSQTAERVNLSEYHIELNNVSFSYEQGGKEVISGLKLSMAQGSFTALVGPSGGGKSTIARLISRFWEVTEGSITIGDTDIRRIPLTQLEELISYVAQDNFLFNCSLFENIRMGKPEASQEEVFQAAKAACCEEFILKLPEGYHTLAGEAGKKLSGGEKQRIALARAMLKNAPIVILDEATAFTDPENEDKLQRSIALLTKGKTLLVIAHRLSTIKQADNIVVLKDGQIKAQGTQSELLQGSSLYRDMWNSHIGARNWAAGSRKEEAYVSDHS
jgi:ATP-binding cassette, subfamily B, bacterial IrtA/YbtP